MSADGLLPSPVTLGFLTLAMVVLSVPLLLGPASTRRLVAMLVGGQLVVHVVLTLATGHTAGHTAHAQSTALPSLQGAPGAGMPTITTPAALWQHLVADLGVHLPMAAAHLAAAALVGWWLAGGERALWTLISLGRGRVPALVHRSIAVAPRPAHVRSFVDSSDHAVLVSLWQARPHTRRGPPLTAA